MLLSRIQTMIDQLNQNPNIKVLIHRTFPPVSSFTFKTLEKKAGHVIDDEFKSFYSQTNGFQLAWCATTQNTTYSLPDYEEFDWFTPYHQPLALDGCIMLLPIEMIFNHDWSKTLALTSDLQTQSVKPFDLYHNTYHTALFFDANTPIQLLSNIENGSYQPQVITTFNQYIEHLIAHKGLVSKRFETTPTTIIKDWLIKRQFPKSEEKSSNTTTLKTGLMQQMSKNTPPLTIFDIQKILINHHDFLASGGAGGRWETFEVSGLVFGIYIGATSKSGTQATLEQKHLPNEVDMKKVLLPFSNCCALYSPNQDFTDADLSFSLFTDAFLVNTIFDGCNLQNTDFSRANLRFTSFKNANLKNTDFENCDLTGADFTGANISEAIFPGAILTDVKI